jgi:hypothetical protein
MLVLAAGVIGAAIQAAAWFGVALLTAAGAIIVAGLRCADNLNAKGVIALDGYASTHAGGHRAGPLSIASRSRTA